MKFYVGTGLERYDECRRVHKKLYSMGHEVTFDWTSGVRPLEERTITYMSGTSSSEIHGVREADAAIFLLPGGRGTHAELGAALGLGKPVLLHGPEDLFRFEATCTFYYHPLITRIHRPMNSFIENLDSYIVAL